MKVTIFLAASNFSVAFFDAIHDYDELSYVWFATGVMWTIVSLITAHKAGNK